MMELTSTRVDMGRMELIDITCDQGGNAINYFLISAMLLTDIQIDLLYIRRVYNPLFALVSSDLTLNGMDILSVTATTLKSSIFHISDSTVTLKNGLVKDIRGETEELFLVTFGELNFDNMTITRAD